MGQIRGLLTITTMYKNTANASQDSFYVHTCIMYVRYFSVSMILSILSCTYSSCKLMPDRLFYIAHIIKYFYLAFFQLMHMVNQRLTLFADSAKLANWRCSDTVFGCESEAFHSLYIAMSKKICPIYLCSYISYPQVCLLDPSNN